MSSDSHEIYSKKYAQIQAYNILIHITRIESQESHFELVADVWIGYYRKLQTEITHSVRFLHTIVEFAWAAVAKAMNCLKIQSLLVKFSEIKATVLHIILRKVRPIEWNSWKMECTVHGVVVVVFAAADPNLRNRNSGTDICSNKQ